MKIIGCDLHAAQQTIAMLDRETGEVVEKTLKHEAETVWEFYAALAAPVWSGSKPQDPWDGSAVARGTRHHVPRGTSGDDPKSRDTQAETRSTRCGIAAPVAHGESVPGNLDTLDRLAGFAGPIATPAQWVRLRTRVQNALHAIALGYGVQRGHALWNRDGQAMLTALPLPPHAAHRRDELQALYQHLDEQVDRLDDRVRQSSVAPSTPPWGVP